MKKLLAMFTMVAVIGCTVVGCGDDKPKTPVKEKTTTTNTDKTSTTEKTTTTK
jgi:hypothetical protein